MPEGHAVAETTWSALCELARERVALNEPLRRRLPGGGWVRIERQLPFLLVYRRPKQSDRGTPELVTSEAAFLSTTASAHDAPRIATLCSTVVDVLRQQFDFILLIEIWADELCATSGEARRSAPGFRICAADADAIPTTINALRDALTRITIDGAQAEVSLDEQHSPAPHGLTPMLGQDLRCVQIGLAVRPIYRSASGDEVYPTVLQSLRRQLSGALRASVFAFSGVRDRNPHAHFDSFGPSAMRRPADLVDQQLSAVASSFDFILQVTPLNSEQLWSEFQQSGCRKLPRLHYRPLPFHPAALKRKLFEIPIEDVEDPTLAWLLAQKQAEIDHQIAALNEIGSPAFLYSSLLLYDQPEDALVELADSILTETADHSRELHGRDTSDEIDAVAMAALARAEIEVYRLEQPQFQGTVEIADGVAAGMMVVGDRLLISPEFRLAAERVLPLMHHEVGTHLLTYSNGRSQPLRQLATGLAGYESLQEGLAVLAEQLTGGLSVGRLRAIAARVIAVQSAVDRVAFPETYSRLIRYGVRPHRAFVTSLRAYRAGGLSKDALYLRGLCEALQHLARGNELEPLFVGKFSLAQLPSVQELRRRGIVRPPNVLPRYWVSEGFRTRLDKLRQMSVLDLLHDALTLEHTTGDRR